MRTALRRICLLCALVTMAPGCGAKDCEDEDGDGAGAGCPAPDCDDTDALVAADCGEAGWRPIVDSLEDGWLLSSWGSGPQDVWFAGGTRDSSLVLHFDGVELTSEPIDGDALLWWVWGSEEQDLWVVGDKSAVFRRQGGAFVAVPSPVEGAVFYGVWGQNRDDLWIVGNVAVEGAAPRGVILRAQGGADPEEVLVAGDPLPGLFKVWGSGADDVYIVGETGTLLHWNGTDMERLDAGTRVRLFTVHGCGPGEAYLVGGFGNGVVLEQQGTQWVDVSPPFAPLINGVHCSDQTVRVVGNQGYVATRTQDGWEEALPTNLDLHGIWNQGADLAYAVGGNLLGAAITGEQRGVLLRFGR